MNYNAFTQKSAVFRGILCAAAVAVMAAGPASSGQERLATFAKDSFARFGLSPMPRLRIVKADSPDLERGEIARAVLFESGKEEVRVSVGLLNDRRLQGALDHESAHLRTWREHGPDVEVHGPEFRKICRRYAADPSSCDTHM